MTHRHEWTAAPIDIWCEICDESLSDAEIARRLNAVEHLSKTSALAAHLTTRNSGDWVSAEDLLNYADALEGKDDEVREE